MEMMPQHGRDELVGRRYSFGTGPRRKLLVKSRARGVAKWAQLKICWPSRAGPEMSAL